MSAARPWSAADTARLRELAGSLSHRAIAERLNRSVASIRSRTKLLGLVNKGRHFTPEQIETVRRMRPTHTCAQIAAAVGKTRYSIYGLAQRMRWCDPMRYSQVFLDRVRELHGQGLNDRQIADGMKDLGVKAGDAGRCQVKHVRHDRLKLPCNAAAVLAARRRGVQTQYQRLGIKTAGELRALSYRNYARENGYPEDGGADKSQQVVIVNQPTQPNALATIKDATINTPAGMMEKYAEDPDQACTRCSMYEREEGSKLCMTCRNCEKQQREFDQGGDLKHEHRPKEKKRIKAS